MPYLYHHDKIFQKLIQTWNKFSNNLYLAFLFLLSIVFTRKYKLILNILSQSFYPCLYVYTIYGSNIVFSCINVCQVSREMLKTEAVGLIMQGWFWDSDASLPFFSDRHTNAPLMTKLDCTVASPVGRCYCLPENPDKLWLHVAGHCRVVKSVDVAAREGLQPGGGSHPLPYCCHIALYNNQLWFYPVRNAYYSSMDILSRIR